MLVGDLCLCLCNFFGGRFIRAFVNSELVTSAFSFSFLKIDVSCDLTLPYRYIYFLISLMFSKYGNLVQQSMDQLGKVANPSRGQLNREE